MPTGTAKGPSSQVIAIDHVQLAMSAGGEAEARRFYGGVLGLREVPKPAGLAGRGGCWFTSADESAAVHLGVEDDFRPARKAHPAFVVANLDGLRARLAGAGAEIVEDDTIDARRFYTADPFGNRIELVAEADRGFTTPKVSGPSSPGDRPSGVTLDQADDTASRAAP